MKKVSVNPGKAQSVMGAVVGLVFCALGVFVAIPTFGIFGIFWTVIAAVIAVSNIANAVGKKGVSTHEIVIEDDEPHNVDHDREFTTCAKLDENGMANTELIAVEKRLSSLKDLYGAGIITKQEYEERRAKIIDESTK